MPFFKYNDLPVVHPSQDVARRLAHSAHMMMVVIDFTNGPQLPAPPHRHPHEQISYVAQGPFRFYIGEGQNQEAALVETGDLIVIPPNEPHTVELLAETGRLVDCFHPIREDFL